MTVLLRPLAAVLLCLSVFAALPGALHAQSSKIFVASFGKDTNAGTPASPKRNFQAAHDAVAAGGEIVVLDTAGYGVVTITKGVSIVVAPGVNAFITAAGGASGIIINAATTDVVTLRGLIIETNANGIGLQVGTAGTVSVEDCTVRNFNAGISAGYDAAVHLLVRNCTVRDVAYGVIVMRGDGVVTGCALDNASAVAAEADSGDSGENTRLTLVNCTLTHNGYALYASSSLGIVLADNCTFSGNANGVAGPVGTPLLSRGNNTFFNNTSNGSFTSTLAAQ